MSTQCLQIAAKSQAGRKKPREQVVIEVLVDLLLDMVGITLHEGLLYLLEQVPESYPVSSAMLYIMTAIQVLMFSCACLLMTTTIASPLLFFRLS